MSGITTGMYISSENNFLPGNEYRLSPYPSSVPNTVATIVLANPSRSVFLTAAILSGLLSNVAYQSVVNPRHGPPYFAALNENTITTTIGAYRKTYRTTDTSPSQTRFTGPHRLSRRPLARRPTTPATPRPSR